MKDNEVDLHSMSTNELWKLHEDVVAQLTDQIVERKNVLEERLRQLAGRSLSGSSHHLNPKFRNPEQPSETWTGRGRQPRWLTAQLRSGKRIDDFRIEHAA